MKLIKNYLPAVLTVIVALIAWSELSGLYGKARATIASKVQRGE